MPEENNPPPIGEPEPMPEAKRQKLIKEVLAGFGLALGGLLAFGVLVTPTHTMGVTRSLKLKWQQRQHGAQDAVGVALSAATNTAPAAPQGGPPDSRRE